MRTYMLCLLVPALLVGCQPRQADEEAAGEAATEVAEDVRAAAEAAAAAELEARAAAETARRERMMAEAAPSEPMEAAAEPQAGDALEFRQLAQGIEFFDGKARAGATMVRLSAVRVAMPRPGIALAVSEDLKGGGHSLIAYQKIAEARIVLSGGFVTSFYPAIPAGYVQFHSMPINRAATDPILNGMLRISRGRASIGPFEEPDYERLTGDALQSGPLLVHGGRPVLRRAAEVAPDQAVVVEGAFIRSFVAVDKQGHALLGWVSEVSLTELVELLLRPEQARGLDCESALNLSGHVNAGLLVSAGDVYHEVGDVATRLPNAIVVR